MLGWWDRWKGGFAGKVQFAKGFGITDPKWPTGPEPSGGRPFAKHGSKRIGQEEEGPGYDPTSREIVTTRDVLQRNAECYPWWSRSLRRWCQLPYPVDKFAEVPLLFFMHNIVEIGEILEILEISALPPG